MSSTYYDKFGLKQEASLDEIRKAYRRLAIKYHPDKNKNDDKYNNLFKNINYMYEILLDPTKRKEYDISINVQSDYHQEKTYVPYEKFDPHSEYKGKGFFGILFAIYNDLPGFIRPYVVIFLLVLLYPVILLFTNDKKESAVIKKYEAPSTAFPQDPKTGEIFFSDSPVKKIMKPTTKQKEKKNTSINRSNSMKEKEETSQNTGEVQF